MHTIYPRLLIALHSLLSYFRSVWRSVYLDIKTVQPKCLCSVELSEGGGGMEFGEFFRIKHFSQKISRILQVSKVMFLDQN